jgi:hypothetical protein
MGILIEGGLPDPPGFFGGEGATVDLSKIRSRGFCI